MTFTDDDIARCHRMLNSEMSMQKIVLNNPEIATLLARLEAAEKIVNRMCVHAGPWRGKLDDCFKDDVQAWRKAAGK